jgi:predicted permease
LALIALGADMSFTKQELFYDVKLTVLIAVIRLIVVPSVIVSLGYGTVSVAWNWRDCWWCWGPLGVSGYQMAMQLNADSRLARQAIIYTSLLSLLTLSIFITCFSIEFVIKRPSWPV